jgi:hypothetical protein
VELVDFLLARIAKDEDLARSVQQRHAFLEPYAPAVPGLGLEWDDHMVYAPPLRVLAECEAKRQIVEAHRWEEFDDGDGSVPYYTDCDDCRQSPPCRTLRLLALPYADHPDYREEWRP